MTKLVPYEKAAKTLRHWAPLEKTVDLAKNKHAIDWTPVQSLIDAVQPLLELEREHLRALLEKSKRRLDPLDDPLRVDFGAHRWLKSEREEAYSDWLAWIVEQMETSERIFRLFGVKDLELQNRCTGPVIVKREESVSKGHEGHSGRIDLIVSFGSRKTLVIEVKMRDADSADTGKQKGYSQSLLSIKRRVLIATAGEHDQYPGGFYLRKWKDVCLELRRIVLKLLEEEKRIQSAMILAFIGAVEQNILGFPRNLAQRIEDHIPVSSSISDHLENYWKEDS